MSNTKTLDLKVPKGWAQCTTEELEMIAEEIIRSQMMASLSRFCRAFMPSIGRR